MKWHFERGLELLDQGRLEEAEGAFRQALAGDARNVKAGINLGVVLQRAGRGAAALEAYRDALAVDAGVAQGWFNVGALQIERGRHCDAVEPLRRALALDPGRTEWHCALAWALLQSGDAQGAAAAGRGALQIDPGRQEAHSVVLQSMHYLPGASAEEIRAAHVAWGQSAKRATRGIPHANSRDPERKLRIGYVAPEFCEPSLAAFLQPVLSRHDASRVSVFCYSDTRASDPVSWRLRARNVTWRAAGPHPDEEFARGIREDQIDILVDLGGHAVGGRRMGVFAEKPAPVQLSWLGYPGTTGLEAIDYHVGDGYYSAEGAERFYAERLIRLPFSRWCYQPDFGVPPVEPPPAGYAGSVIFGSFNDLACLTPASFALWTRLLREVPDALLVLALPQADQLAGRVGELCSTTGIETRRIRLEPVESRAALHALLGQVDIALDTVPCAGTVATLDALWMGVPVVTKTGPYASARCGASLLEAAGLRELIATSEDAYLEIALGLARDLPRLARLRGGMRARLRGSALLDAARFTRELEAAYRQVWRDWCAGRAARAQSIAPARTQAPPPAVRAAARGAARGRVILDGVFLRNAGTGIARVWRALLGEWAKSGFAERVLLLDRDGSVPQIPGVRRRTVTRHDYVRLAADRAMLQRVCDEEQAAVFISTYYSAPQTTPCVLLLHDMIPELFGADLSRSEWREKDACIRGAARIVAVSTSTARDLCHFYPEVGPARVLVAHNGVDPAFAPAAAADIERFRAKHGVARPYFLLVGSRAAYKNGDAFFQAFSRIPAHGRYAVVCAGGEPRLEPAQQQACAGSAVHMLQVDDQDLRIAYAGAIALVYPSVYEGFGLPVLEAMASGCPVITSAHGALAEVAGEAALRIDPMNVSDLALALGDVQGRGTREALIAAGLEQARKFSWEAMAQRLAATLEEVAAEPAGADALQAP